MRAVAARAFPFCDRLVNERLDELLRDRSVATDAEGDARALDEVFAAPRVRSVTGGAIAVLRWCMHPRALLILLREVPVTRRAELEALRVQGHRRTRALRRLVARGAIGVEEGFVRVGIEQSLLLGHMGVM